MIANLLDATGTVVSPATEDGNLALVKGNTDKLDVLLSTRATEATALAQSAKFNPIGVHANLWNAAVVGVNGNSASVDCQYNKTISIFGNVSNNVNPMRVQVSQDNINFYTITVFTASNGNFGITLDCGARFVRLQAGQAATITATLAGKF